MGLITCPDCEKDVSENAPACPGCGSPIAERPKKGEIVQYSDQEVAAMLSNKKSTSHLLHLILCIPTVGLWLLIWLLVAASNGSENAKIDRKIKKGKKVK